MKNVSKILMSIFLVAIALTMPVAPAFAQASAATIDYVAFGDSDAAGVRGGIKEPGSDFGYTDNLAGMFKSAGMLSSFNEEFCTSGMTAKRLALNTQVLNDKASSGYALVNKAEIATLTIGANDLLAPLYEYMSALKDVSSVDMAKVKEILEIVAKQVYDGTTAPQIEANIEIILQNILNANPKVKIFVMGYYNPLPMVSAMAGVDMNTPLKDFNGYIQKAIADVTAKNAGASIFYVDTMAAIAADINNNLVFTDIHPTQAGYIAIANEFWKQVKLLLAAPTQSAVLVNGKSVKFEAYNINDNNYFKLRDIAMVLQATAKQFNVSWDEKNNAIALTSKTPYTVSGGELAVTGATSSVMAEKTTSAVYLDGKAINLAAYCIGGYNYFKLRDLAAAINFGVGWNEASGTISLDTAVGYTA